MNRRRSAELIALFALLVTCPLIHAQEVVDTTVLRADDLGFVFFEQKADPSTGFVVGGKNRTADLNGLMSINWQVNSHA